MVGLCWWLQHPHQAQHYTPELAARILKCFEHPSAVAYGEVSFWRHARAGGVGERRRLVYGEHVVVLTVGWGRRHRSVWTTRRSSAPTMCSELSFASRCGQLGVLPRCVVCITTRSNGTLPCVCVCVAFGRSSKWLWSLGSPLCCTFERLKQTLLKS